MAPRRQQEPTRGAAPTARTGCARSARAASDGALARSRGSERQNPTLRARASSLIAARRSGARKPSARALEQSLPTACARKLERAPFVGFRSSSSWMRPRRTAFEPRSRYERPTEGTRHGRRIRPAGRTCDRASSISCAHRGSSSSFRRGSSTAKLTGGSAIEGSGAHAAIAASRGARSRRRARPRSAAVEREAVDAGVRRGNRSPERTTAPSATMTTASLEQRRR